MIDSMAGIATNTSTQVTDRAAEIHQMISRLYPICRSITGNGVRESLKIMQAYLPLQIHEVPTGTQVFDWTVPKEWNIRDAYIKNEAGERIVDFHAHNLHVLNYSIPVHRTLSLDELKPHLFSLPDQPDLIPYRTSYYQENWGFCLPDRQLQELKPGPYEVCIDSSLEPGHLTYGEYFVQGELNDEILVSCHICHPSLANDNLSGNAVAIFLARHLSQIQTRYSYRFVFVPGTIGAITWLAQNQQQISHIRHGLVATLLGDAAGFTYKKTRKGNAEIDRAVIHYLQQAGKDHTIIDFFPYGYDERQYNSPGINLDVGCLSRSQYGQYPEYHTSADNLDLISTAQIEAAIDAFLAIFQTIEHNRTYINLNPQCEPQLGKRGLYQHISGDSQSDSKDRQLAMLWVLNLSDGHHSLLDIAERAGLRFETIRQIAAILEQHHLLQKTD
jgi:aminopeptidase-like protein